MEKVLVFELQSSTFLILGEAESFVSLMGRKEIWSYESLLF